MKTVPAVLVQKDCRMASFLDKLKALALFLRAGAQVAEKVEVQEVVPPAGVLGAEPLSLMPQHFPREPAKRCFQAMAANQVFFDSLSPGALSTRRGYCFSVSDIRFFPTGQSNPASG